MEWVKTTAKTLPEAIDLALDNLGVDESEAEIVILEEPRPGLFGRVRGTARVEARVKPKPIRPKTERTRNRRKSGDGNRSRGRKGGKGGDGDKGGQRSQGRDGARSGAGEGRNEGRGGGNGRGGNGRGGGNGGRTRGRDGGERNGSKDARTAGARSERKVRSGERGGGGGGRSRSADRAQETNPNEGASVEDVAAHLRTFLTELTEAFGFDSDVVIDDSEKDSLIGRIEGRHGLLVGPKGRTLDAVQELARISCQRTVPSSVRIKVDVGGYREQRVAALAGFAGKAADKAVADGVEVALEPMSPADRKAVHDALSDDSRVETRSVGSEPRRKVLVVPLDVDEEELTEVEDAVANGSGVADDAEE